MLSQGFSFGSDLFGQDVKSNSEFPMPHGSTLPIDLQVFCNRITNKLTNGRKIRENTQKNFTQQEVKQEVGVSPLGLESGVCAPIIRSCNFCCS